MDSKFSPDIIINDFKKFYSNDKLMLVYIPLIASLILSFVIKINMSLINLLFVALSIFIGFLLNLMLMSFNLKDSNVLPIEYAGKQWYLSDFLEEYHNTISFEILITMLLVILMLFTSLVHQNISLLIPNFVWILKLSFNFIMVYFFIVFFLLLFRVLKFGHILLKYYIKN
ncbi:hypothetical protein [Methanobrevibacter sp.]|uniref:hypothetical protein n=1 Tax=Methanobrevibacter sp. TaxID=66852 RepID=UPI0026E0650C|nr:hypothetical protein [Methanobrevibacter sp.]MDO5824387.1 hypothetical protein [Methanobrevibacter sp.]